MIERLPYKVSWSSKKTHCVRNTKFARICLASEIKPGNPQVEKSNMMITWRRGRKVSKVTRASGPPLLFVDCTCEQVAWALSKVMTAILIEMIMMAVLITKMFSLPASSRRPPSGSGQELAGPHPLGSPARCEDESSLRVALQLITRVQCTKAFSWGSVSEGTH